MRSLCCLCVCVSPLNFSIFYVVRVVSKERRQLVLTTASCVWDYFRIFLRIPLNFFVFCAVRVVSRRLMKSPCYLCVFVSVSVSVCLHPFPISMWFMSYEKKVDSSQNFLFPLSC
jgi:hypothetical protein